VIPQLCHKEGLRADGNCRACVVEIAGERSLVPSCCRVPSEGPAPDCLGVTGAGSPASERVMQYQQPL
jgi:NADH dehydrogenase/NADH:ubiquinone oxidoreductase subunit G